MGSGVHIEVEESSLGPTEEIAKDGVVENGGLENDVIVQSNLEINLSVENIGKGKACSSDSENISPSNLKMKV